MKIDKSLAGRLRTLLRLRRLYWLRAELHFAPTEAQRLLALTVVIGVVCGLAAVAFHESIRFVSEMLIDRALSSSGPSWVVATILTPTAGALVAGLLLTYVVPSARGSGIPQVKAAFAIRGTSVRLRDSIGKFVIGTLQIGTGSSLGREGPTVQICAGIATRLGRSIGISGQSLRRLLPVGAAAGIAAAFNAPIAAVTFTIEEIVGNLDQTVLSGVIVAAALAAVIERSVLGESPVFNIPQGYGLRHASSLVVYAGLGLAAAFVSILFTDSLLGLRARMRRLEVLPRWAHPAVGGLVTGLLAVLAFAWLRVRGVTGGGYETLVPALSGKLAVHVMIVLCAMKLAATVFSYATGGAGGIFAPALFIGGMLGGAFGAVDVAIFRHEPVETVGAFALVGMGAVFSGIIRAPITSVLIIVEMTSGYALILPLMIANMSAYVIARRMRPVPIYEALLAQDGLHLPDRVFMDSLEGVGLAELIQNAPSRSFEPTSPGSELVRRPPGMRTQDVYPVTSDERIVGIITSEEMDILAAEPELWGLVNATDVMRPPFFIKTEDDVRTALEAMIDHGVREVPVVDAGGHVVGFVDEGAVAKAYMREVGADIVRSR